MEKRRLNGNERRTKLAIQRNSLRWEREMTDFEQKVLEELSALKVQMHQLMGVGQPGRLHLLEQRVESHERNVQRLKGLAGAFGGALTFVHLAIAYLGGKH